MPGPRPAPPPVAKSLCVALARAVGSKRLAPRQPPPVDAAARMNFGPEELKAMASRLSLGREIRSKCARERITPSRRRNSECNFGALGGGILLFDWNLGGPERIGEKALFPASKTTIACDTPLGALPRRPNILQVPAPGADARTREVVPGDTCAALPPPTPHARHPAQTDPGRKRNALLLRNYKIEDAPPFTSAPYWRSGGPFSAQAPSGPLLFFVICFPHGQSPLL